MIQKPYTFLAHSTEINTEMNANFDPLYTYINTPTLPLVMDGTSGVNLIPVMTSNTTPNGLAFSNDELNSDTRSYNAMDGNINTYWQCRHQGISILGYIFVLQEIVGSYTYTSWNINNHLNPDMIVLQGSNNTSDGSDGTWLDIDIRDNLSWNVGEIKTFQITNNIPYLAYRICLSNSNVNQDYFLCSEFKLISKDTPNTYPLNPINGQSIIDITDSNNKYLKVYNNGSWI